MDDDKTIRATDLGDATSGRDLSHGHPVSGKRVAAAVPPPKPLKKASAKSPDARKND